MLPGAQHLQQQKELNENQHMNNLTNLRNNALYRASLESNPELQVISPTSSVHVGDWVVYLLPTYKEKIKEELKDKYGNHWSLPAKVIRKGDKQVTIETWRELTKIDVPMSKVRVLQHDVPASLQAINLQQLHMESPSSGPPPVFLDGALSRTTSWDELHAEVSGSPLGPTDVNRKRKRACRSVHFQD